MEESLSNPVASAKSPTNEVGPSSYTVGKGRGTSEELNLRQVLFILRHRLWLILAIAGGVSFAVLLWTLQQRQVFEGNFQLLVGDPIVQQDPTRQMVLDQLGVKEVDYDTQIAVLKSSSILQPILEQISLQYPEIDYENLVGRNNPYLSINQLKDTKILQVSFLDSDREKIEYVLNALSKAYLAYSLDERKIQINQGIKFVDDQLPKLRQRVNARQAQLQKFRQQHNLLDPELRAKELSNLEFSLKAKYVDLQVSTREVMSLYSVLQRQLGLSSENALASSDLSESPRYQNLLNQLQAIELELAKQSALYSDENPIIQNLKTKQENLKPLLRQEAQAVLGDRFNTLDYQSSLSSPGALRLNLNQQYIQTANQLQVQKTKLAAIEQELNEVNKQVKQMPTLARQYMDLQREMNVATESLSRFLEAQEKLQIDAAQQTIPWQLISPPSVDETAIWPKPARNISLGIIAGLLFGVGAAFLLERLDPVFHSVEELKEETQVPILGMIPWQKDLQLVEKVVGVNVSPMISSPASPSAKSTKQTTNRPSRSGYRSSGFLEAFRSFNTNIWLLGSDHPIRSLVISSATPGDGKTTTSLNLAQAAAAMGQKVLLVDADLRRPRVHHFFGLVNTQGLSNVIATGLQAEEAIQKVPQWDNLSILTAGSMPPDPIRLLTSRRMQELMDSWEQSSAYDLIIYDTPPLLSFADARIIASGTTGLILVLKLGKTDRSAFKHVLDDIKMAQAPLLGIVANSVSRNDYGGAGYYNYYNYSQARPS